MNKDRITPEFMFLILKETTKTDFFNNRVVYFEDCVITRIRSIELKRTYDCYHVVGQDIDFILKKSDEYEMNIYQMLNDKNRNEIRLAVPKLYQYVTVKNLKSNKLETWIAIEFIRRNHDDMETLEYGSCNCQVDGLLMYQNGECLDAWKTAAVEIAKIHNKFWKIPELINKSHGVTYDGALETIRNCERIRRDSLVWKAFCKMEKYFMEMSQCLIHFDFMPFNVMIKERAVLMKGEKIITPKTYIIDWATAQTGPYILDIARLISHCVRYGEEANLYCSEVCADAVLNVYYHEVSEQHGISREKFNCDILFGKFFELIRMYAQRPGDTNLNEYDMFYEIGVKKIAHLIMNL